MFTPKGTKQQLHPSVSSSLSATSCKSTGTFYTPVCTLLDSNPAVAPPHLNIRRIASAEYAYALFRIAVIVRIGIDIMDIGQTIFTCDELKGRNI